MANTFWNVASGGEVPYLEGLGGFLGGMFDSGQPYRDYSEEMGKYADKAAGYQQPYLEAGKGAIPNFQNWLSRMQNPSDFINNLMSQYQQSPYAKYQQQQAVRAAQNMGSASGLTGSTPLFDFLQQNAQNISSQDMQKWLERVLGVNTQYGAGEQNLMTGGQNSANALTGMYGSMAPGFGEAAYGARAGRNADMANMISGGLQLASLML